MGTKLVIVESPAKAKTINNYLGKDFTVLASFANTVDRCPRCKAGIMRMIEVRMPWARAVAWPSVTLRVPQMDTS